MKASDRASDLDPEVGLGTISLDGEERAGQQIRWPVMKRIVLFCIVLYCTACIVLICWFGMTFRQSDLSAGAVFVVLLAASAGFNP